MQLVCNHRAFSYANENTDQGMLVMYYYSKGNVM